MCCWCGSINRVGKLKFWGKFRQKAPIIDTNTVDKVMFCIISKPIHQHTTIYSTVFVLYFVLLNKTIRKIESYSYCFKCQIRYLFKCLFDCIVSECLVAVFSSCFLSWLCLYCYPFQFS